MGCVADVEALVASPAGDAPRPRSSKTDSNHDPWLLATSKSCSAVLIISAALAVSAVSAIAAAFVRICRDAVSRPAVPRPAWRPVRSCESPCRLVRVEAG